jgi:hypothetical protein
VKISFYLPSRICIAFCGWASVPSMSPHVPSRFSRTPSPNSQMTSANVHRGRRGQRVSCSPSLWSTRTSLRSRSSGFCFAIRGTIFIPYSWVPADFRLFWVSGPASASSCNDWHSASAAQWQATGSRLRSFSAYYYIIWLYPHSLHSISSNSGFSMYLSLRLHFCASHFHGLSSGGFFSWFLNLRVYVAVFEYWLIYESDVGWGRSLTLHLTI